MRPESPAFTSSLESKGAHAHAHPAIDQCTACACLWTHRDAAPMVPRHPRSFAIERAGDFLFFPEVASRFPLPNYSFCDTLAPTARLALPGQVR